MQLTLPPRALLLVLGLILSCKDSTPETAIRVVVDSDLAIGSELTTIRVRVLDAEDHKEQHRQDFPLTSRSGEQGRYTVPFAFRLAQRANDAVEFRLVVTGRGPLGEDGEEIDVAEQQAITSFRPRTTKRLDMFLARACLGKLCRDEEGDLTCNVASGKCERVEVRDELPTDGGTDGGDDVSDAETQMDAGVEAREYALGEAGKPCASELEQTLACEGHASRRVLKCQKGTWELLETCAQTERCDSRVGTDQGTCAPIPAACVGKAAGDVCDGAERVTCDVDLLSVEDNACTAHSHCTAMEGTHCECNPGYEDDGHGRCADPINECASTDYCTGAYPCVQTEPPGYTCLGQFADWPMPDAAPGSKFAPSYDTTTTPGTVIDLVTDLMWQRFLPATASSPETMYDGCTGTDDPFWCTWEEAKIYCNNLVLAGNSDWRLPTRIELESVLDETKSNPSIDSTAFPNTPQTSFWSSSPYVGYALWQPFPPGDAWTVSFNRASAADGRGIDHYPARCVRGGGTVSGYPQSRYVVNSSNDTVNDTRTGLVWQRTIDSNDYLLEAAISYCSARGSGWRLPSFKELLTVVDPTQAIDAMHAAMDPVAFPNTPLTSFWSSYGRVDFRFGLAISSGTTTSGDPSVHRVRCVR
jgi:hypothetical protein